MDWIITNDLNGVDVFKRIIYQQNRQIKMDPYSWIRTYEPYSGPAGKERRRNYSLDASFKASTYTKIGGCL